MSSVVSKVNLLPVANCVAYSTQLIAKAVSMCRQLVNSHPYAGWSVCKSESEACASAYIYTKATGNSRLGIPGNSKNGHLQFFCTRTQQPTLCSSTIYNRSSLLYWPLPVAVLTLTSGLDFQHVVSCWCSIVIMALKCTVVELEAWERQTDRQMDGCPPQCKMPPPPVVGRGIVKRLRCCRPTGLPPQPQQYLVAFLFLTSPDMGETDTQNAAFLQCLGAPWNTAWKPGIFGNFMRWRGEFFDFWTGISGGAGLTHYNALY